MRVQKSLFLAVISISSKTGAPNGIA